ncbi:MAG: helix-turn-helix transcriptional regulator [Chthoniobacterales bacterium]
MSNRLPLLSPPRTGTFSRPPLARMMQLHAQLQARTFPNCRKLAEELEVSSKTIQRDIDFMRDRLGLPIEYDQLHFGFVYTEPVTSFPNVEVSEGEIVALFVAQKALQQYKGTPFEAPLKAAFQKIGDGLKDKISFTWSELDSSISFRSAGRSLSDIEVFETVSRAVLRSEELEFRYRKLRSSRFEARRVRPYHLGCVENQWYLFAFDLERQQLRTFALPRVRDPQPTGAHFRRPADFSINRFLDSSFGVFRGEGKNLVRIRFDSFAAQLVRERVWHPSQKIRSLPNEELELRLQLGSLEEIERWILSWGEHATVVAPQKLIERMHATARHLATIYAKS